MNYTHIAGHLGADPEVRFTTSGQKVTTLRIAAKARKGGNDETIWWRATIWGDQFDKMMPYLKKGSAVIVVGEMSKPEIYNGKDGTPQISMNMTVASLMFSPFGRTDKQQEAVAPVAQQPQQSSSYTGFATGAMPASSQISDDEIPF